MLEPFDLSISSLRELYANGSIAPSALCSRLREEARRQNNSCFITMTPREDLAARCRALEAMPAAERDRLDLWGIPFAVKDNIDVQGFITTAACPSFSNREATSSAPCVQALLDAGAVMLGKTNMDQFAAGLVGTRSPYGTAKNAFDERFVPGGSSSGSGALVGRNLATFALGTDTAGSGRVPAMLNGCVGIKPTVGKISTLGVVPACKSLDCVSCFAQSVQDAANVIRIMERADSTKRKANVKGAKSQETPVKEHSQLNGHSHRSGFKFGIPGPEFLEFDGPGGPHLAKLYSNAFQKAIAQMEELGGTRVNLNFQPFCEIAEMLYNSAFVAERYAGVRSFLEEEGETTAESIQKDNRMERVTAEIMSKGKDHTAYDLFEAFEKLTELKLKGAEEMEKVDVLLVPTVLQHYLVAEVEAEEKNREPPIWPKNALNGRFTNFVNLMDMAAISIPSDVIRHPTPDSGDDAQKLRHEILGSSDNPNPLLPVGITLIGLAWTDEWLWELGNEMHKASGLRKNSKRPQS